MRSLFTLTCHLSLASCHLPSVASACPPCGPALGSGLLPFVFFRATFLCLLLPGFPFPAFLGELVAEGLELGVVGVFAFEVGGEVEVGEATVEGEGPAVADPGRLDLVVEEADMLVTAEGLDPGQPLVQAIDVPDALEARGAGVEAAIVRVLQRRTDAEVALAVVQAVALDVIDHHAIRGVQDLPVHKDRASARPPDGIPARRIARAAVQGAPLVLVQPIEVGGVDQGVLAMSQGDVLDAVVGRLRRRRPQGRLPPGAEVRAGAAAEDLPELARRLRMIDTDQVPAAAPGRRDRGGHA